MTKPHNLRWESSIGKNNKNLQSKKSKTELFMHDEKESFESYFKMNPEKTNTRHIKELTQTSQGPVTDLETHM